MPVRLYSSSLVARLSLKEALFDGWLCECVYTQVYMRVLAIDDRNRCTVVPCMYSHRLFLQWLSKFSCLCIRNCIYVDRCVYIQYVCTHCREDGDFSGYQPFCLCYVDVLTIERYKQFVHSSRESQSPPLPVPCST